MERRAIPRLDAPDAIFSWGIISLSLRQFALILLAVVVSLNFWSLLGAVELGDMRGVLELVLLAILAVVVVLFGWVKVKGQPFESYLLARIRYSVHPRIAVWHRRDDGKGTS